MKKGSVLVLRIILAVAILLGGILIYITESPEYALMKIAVKVAEGGFEGVKPNLTEKAKNMIEPIFEVSENKLLQAIISLFPGNNGDGDFLMNHLREIEWAYVDLLKNSRRAVVKMGFKHGSDYSGSIDIEFLKLDGEWLVNDLRIYDLESALNDIELPFDFSE